MSETTLVKKLIHAVQYGRPMPKFVNIVTYGRSGSTLLMGILNSIDGYLIRGENNNLFYHFFHIYQQLSGMSLYGTAKKEIADPTSSWFNDINLLQTSAVLLRLWTDILDPKQVARVTGFKEVRWMDIKETRFPQILKLLHWMTDCKFIFNKRNLDDVVKSSWWAENPEESRKTIMAFETRMDAYVEAHPEHCFQITYEDVIGKTPRLKEMFDFLNESYDEDRIDGVLRVRYGPENPYKNKSPQCVSPAERAWINRVNNNMREIHLF